MRDPSCAQRFSCDLKIPNQLETTLARNRRNRTRDLPLSVRKFSRHVLSGRTANIFQRSGEEEKQNFALFVIVADSGKFLHRSQNTQREYFNILFINFYSTLCKIDGKLVNNLVVSQSVLLLKSAHVCPCF